MRAVRARDDFSSSVLAHRAVSRVECVPAPVSSLHLPRLRHSEGEAMSDSAVAYAVGLFIGGVVGWAVCRAKRWNDGRRRP